MSLNPKQNLVFEIELDELMVSHEHIYMAWLVMLRLEGKN